MQGERSAQIGGANAPPNTNKQL